MRLFWLQFSVVIVLLALSAPAFGRGGSRCRMGNNESDWGKFCQCYGEYDTNGRNNYEPFPEGLYPRHYRSCLALGRCSEAVKREVFYGFGPLFRNRGIQDCSLARRGIHFPPLINAKPQKEYIQNYVTCIEAAVQQVTSSGVCQ